MPETIGDVTGNFFSNPDINTLEKESVVGARIFGLYCSGMAVLKQMDETRIKNSVRNHIISQAEIWLYG